MTPVPFALTSTPKVLFGRRHLGLAFEHMYIVPEQEQLTFFFIFIFYLISAKETRPAHSKQFVFGLVCTIFIFQQNNYLFVSMNW